MTTDERIAQTEKYMTDLRKERSRSCNIHEQMGIDDAMRNAKRYIRELRANG